MITFIKQNKLLSIVAVLFVFGVAYYTFMSSGNTAQPTLTSSDSAPSAQTQQLLVVLANLRTIRLDDAVFKDPVFLSLTDFGVVISPEAVGRRNPFAPFVGTSTNQTRISSTILPPVTPTTIGGAQPGVRPPTPRVRVLPNQSQ
jgi:hypothetical protein